MDANTFLKRKSGFKNFKATYEIVSDKTFYRPDLKKTGDLIELLEEFKSTE